MAVLGGLEKGTNGEACTSVTPEMVKKSLEMVEDPVQRVCLLEAKMVTFLFRV
jgi:hypothetical protein